MEEWYIMGNLIHWSAYLVLAAAAAVYVFLTIAARKGSATRSRDNKRGFNG
jgi:hypothetical protein